jgi:small-conductance mechanosensitive channel
MEKNPQQSKPDEVAKDVAQVSKQQASAEEQKTNPQNNSVAEESKTVSEQEKSKNFGKQFGQTNLATPDILIDENANIFTWLENASQTPRHLKNLWDDLDSKIELIEDILSKQSKQAKRVPGIDKRIETMDLFDEQLAIGEKYLSDLNKIKLQTELTNLREKRFQVRQKFVKVYGSEKIALQYEGLRAKAKSKLYHSKSSYFIKQRILKILNVILKADKSGLVEVKNVAANLSDDSLKLFTEKMRDLVSSYDEDCVILCSHINRDYYFNCMQSTLLKWNAETDFEIIELVEPNE